MKKLILALAIFAASTTANAVPVVLISHEVTLSAGTAWYLPTDGNHPEGQPSTATFNWDGATLTSSGLFSSIFAFGDNPFSQNALYIDDITDLMISTGGTPGGTASASAYGCTDGLFSATIFVSACGNYDFGENAINESVTIWGPGLAVSQTLGGDDVSAGAPRTISAYDFGFDGFSGVDGLSPGDLIFIGNGILPGVIDPVLGRGVRMTFQVVPVPASVWLFGSALGLLGWSRRRRSDKL